MDAGRNFDLDRLVVGRAALAVAGLAGVVDDVARAVAGRALHLRLHLAEDGALHGHDAARAMAARARRDLAALRGARAMAILAGGQAVVGHGLGAAGRGLLERDAQRDAHVTADRAGGAPAARGPAVEERRQDVVHAEATEDVGHVDAGAAEAARAVGVAEAVVIGALLIVREDRVGLVDLLELLLGVRRLVDVGVERPRLLEKRALDGPRVGIVRDAEHLVVVDLRFHARRTRFLSA